MTSNGTEKGSGTVKGSAHQIGRLGAHCTNLKHWKVREKKILWKMYRIREAQVKTKARPNIYTAVGVSLGLADKPAVAFRLVRHTTSARVRGHTTTGRRDG